MRGNKKIIRKVFILQLFTVFVFTLSAEPYKPYPVIFVHGLGSSSKTWGAEAHIEADMYTDLIDAGKLVSGHTYDHFLDYMNPYAIVWWKIDKSYTHPDSSPAYPNKTFLEVVNFKKSL